MRRSYKTTVPPITDPAVEAVFASYPVDVGCKLMELRSLIYEAGEAVDEIGELTETLKWRQPAYLPSRPKIGTTIRIDAVKNNPQKYAMYVHCQTSLLTMFGELYPDQLTFEGNRALIFDCTDELPKAALMHCIQLALTYHLKTHSRLFAMPA